MRDALRADRVTGVAVCFSMASLFVELVRSTSSPVLSLSRSTTWIAVLAPVFLDAFDFEVAVKSISLGLTTGGRVLLDTRLNGSVRPSPLGDESLPSWKQLTPFTRVAGVAFWAEETDRFIGVRF